MTEADLITWLSAHPFLKAQIILVFGTVSSFIVKDLESFKKAEPGSVFLWSRSAKECGKGVLLAVIPSLIAKVWQILGA